MQNNDKVKVKRVANKIFVERPDLFIDHANEYGDINYINLKTILEKLRINLSEKDYFDLQKELYKIYKKNKYFAGISFYELNKREKKNDAYKFF